MNAKNGGPAFKHSEAFSFQVATDDQAETDRYWNAIVGNGGQESECGWCKDRWGLSWQITPRTLTEALAKGGAESACGWCKDRWGLSWQITPRTLTDALAAGGSEAKRAFEAMMKMRKIDVAAIEAARRG